MDASAALDEAPVTKKAKVDPRNAGKENLLPEAQTPTSSKAKNSAPSKSKPKPSAKAKTPAKPPPGKQKAKKTTTDVNAPKRKRCMPKTVDKLLEKMKIDPKKVSCCLKAAMSKGFVKITGDVSDLEQVVLEGKYDDHTYKVLVKDVLYQPDYGGNDYCDLADVTVTCVCCDMEKDDYDEGEVFPMFIY